MLQKIPNPFILPRRTTSALTQFYSFRWNFQLMAANGYCCSANRRGMPGHGVEWNEQISKDWGGQVMDDYLSD
jgi:dipeptidyl aminopeptidase/acylaminoacyl peptidase